MQAILHTYHSSLSIIIAVLGAFYPWAPPHAVYLMTNIAVLLEFRFNARGFLISRQMNLVNFFVVFTWLLRSAEALTLILGTPSHLLFVASAFIRICYRPHCHEDGFLGGFVHLPQGDHIRTPALHSVEPIH